MGARMPYFLNIARVAGLAICVACGSTQADTLDKLQVSRAIYLGHRSASVPFSFLSKSCEPAGLAVELCKHFALALSRELKLPLQMVWVPVGPNERNSALTDGLIDIDCADSTVSNQSLSEVGLTIPLFIAATRLMVPGAAEGTDLGRFYGKKVVTTSQSGNEAMLRYVLGQTGVNATVVLARTPKAAMELLRKGEAQALFADDATLFAIKLSAASETYSIVPKVYSMRAKAVAFRKEEPKLRALLSREMRALIKDGTLARWHEQWLNSPLPDQQVNLGVPISYLLRETWKNPSDSFVDQAFGHLPD